MIREGTAARNLEALVPLLCDKYVERCMFCTDDKHPNDLLEKGHIDYIVKKAISLGADPITAIKAACHNAARYFLLNNRGAIAPGYLADFVIIDDFDHFNIEKVYKRGVLMVDHGVVADFPVPEIDPYLVNRAHDTFHVAPLTAADFTDSRPHAVIGMVNGEITTTDGGYTDRIDVDYDILKIAVIERHKNTHHIGLGYIKGYGLQKGAVATSISHDSHNIIVVGTNEEDMAFAANRIVQQHGGITVVENGQVKGELLLAIAGIMSDDTLINVNRDLENAKKAAYDPELHGPAGDPQPAYHHPRRVRRHHSALRLIPAPRFAGTYIRKKRKPARAFFFCSQLQFTIQAHDRAATDTDRHGAVLFIQKAAYLAGPTHVLALQKHILLLRLHIASQVKIIRQCTVAGPGGTLLRDVVQGRVVAAPGRHAIPPRAEHMHAGHIVLP